MFLLTDPLLGDEDVTNWARAACEYRAKLLAYDGVEVDDSINEDPMQVGRAYGDGASGGYGGTGRSHGHLNFSSAYRFHGDSCERCGECADDDDMRMSEAMGFVLCAPCRESDSS